jgi:hypothetical protein
MSPSPNSSNTQRRIGALRATAVILAATATLALAALSAGSAYAGETSKVSLKAFGAGINLDPSPKIEETGLPLYPGASLDRGRHRGEDGDHGDGVNLNLWFGSYGLKVVVVKLKSEDNVADVERFYQQALASYGEVLDCTDTRRGESAAERRAIAKANKNSSVLTCGDTQLNKSARRDGKFYKAGTKAKQYAVAIQSDGSGANIQLLHFEKRGGDD